MVGLKHIERLLWPLKRRILLLVGRAVLKLVDDSLKFQQVQVQGLRDETLDDVERFQNYGFTSHPHPEAEVLLLSMGGMRSHSVAIAVDDRRYRVKGLAEGEVALYTSEHGAGSERHIIHMKNGRMIEMRCGNSSIVMTPSNITLTATRIDLNP